MIAATEDAWLPGDQQFPGDAAHAACRWGVSTGWPFCPPWGHAVAPRSWEGSCWRSRLSGMRVKITADPDSRGGGPGNGRDGGVQMPMHQAV